MNSSAPVNSQGKYAHNTADRGEYDHAVTNDKTHDSTKPIQELSSKHPSYDKTQEDAAIRELEEETGLKRRKEQLQQIRSSTYEYGNPPRQNHSTCYLLDIRNEGKLPPVKEGDDLKDLEWVPLTEIKQLKGKSTNDDGTPRITLCYKGQEIMRPNRIIRTISHIRDKEIETHGVTREKVNKFSEKFLYDPKPSTEFGDEAMAWHERALEIAKSMQKKLNEFGQQPQSEAARS